MSRPPKPLPPPAARVTFLLGASDTDLDSFELARLAAVAEIRKGLIDAIDRMVDELAQAAISRWFKVNDRAALKRALETEEDAATWAKRKIREGQRSESELVPRISVAVSASARSAAYKERQIAKGLCSLCPKPLDRNSVRYCSRHKEIQRLRKKPKGAKGELPGAIAWLYSDEPFESVHGKRPGTIKALREANEGRAKKAKK